MLFPLTASALDASSSPVPPACCAHTKLPAAACVSKFRYEYVGTSEPALVRVARAKFRRSAADERAPPHIRWLPVQGQRVWYNRLPVPPARCAHTKLPVLPASVSLATNRSSAVPYCSATLVRVDGAKVSPQSYGKRQPCRNCQPCIRLVPVTAKSLAYVVSPYHQPAVPTRSCPCCPHQ